MLEYLQHRQPLEFAREQKASEEHSQSVQQEIETDPDQVFARETPNATQDKHVSHKVVQLHRKQNNGDHVHEAENRCHPGENKEKKQHYFD